MRRRQAAWLGLALALAAGSPPDGARAGERRIASPAQEGEFAPFWPGGRFEFGGDETRRWVRVTTAGDGTTALFANRTPYAPPIDFRGRFVQVQVKVEDLGRLGGMQFRLSSDGLATSWFAFTVPLFTDAPTNLLQAGEWQTLSFSFGNAAVTGSPDRARIDTIGWALHDNGNAGSARPLVAYWSDLSALDEAPRGLVSLTFDDGYDEHYQIAAPLLAKHGFSGTAYVMPDQIGQPGYLTLAQLHELEDRHGWDIAAHHFDPLTNFAPAELEALLRRTRGWLEAQGFRRGARHLAYPLGKQDPVTVLPLTRRFFDTARLASAGPETLPPGDRYRLRALNVTRDTTPDAIRAAARRAREHHEWLILMFHWLVEDPEWDTQYAIRDFERVLDGIDQEDVAVLPLSRAWDEVVAAEPR
jgi:peptidoglycan/xylan/chitin deacetylase (PgdA/CDA1 family)